MNADGRQRRRLTQHEPDTIAGSPTWASDSKRIAFHTVQRDPGGARFLSPRLYVVDTEGKNLQKVADGLAPVWSPDSKRLLYTVVAPEGGAKAEVWVMDADGSDPKRLVTGSAEAVWSPDGKQVAYIAGLGRGDPAGPHLDGLYVMNADGSKPTLVAQAESTMVGLCWLPDGRIVYTRAKISPLLVPDESAVYILEKDRKSARKLMDSALTSGGGYGTLCIQVLIGMYVQAPPELKKQMETGR